MQLQKKRSATSVLVYPAARHQNHSKGYTDTSIGEPHYSKKKLSHLQNLHVDINCLSKPDLSYH